MPYIFTITGATGAGKSTILRFLEQRTAGGLSVKIIPKFSTRDARADDDPEEIVPVPAIPPTCDLVYEQYGARYGVSLKQLHEMVSAGRSPALVINDIRVLEEIREVFGPLMRSIYVFRESPDIERIAELAQRRGVTDAQLINRRFRKAQAIFRIYIENIEVFDYVVMNVRGSDDLRGQAAAIVAHLSRISQSPLRQA